MPRKGQEQGGRHGVGGKRKPTHVSRGFRLLPVDLLKHLLQPPLQGLVLRTLVELADEVAAGAECVAAELQSRQAEILMESANDELSSIYLHRGRRTKEFLDISPGSYSPCYRHGP